MKSYSDRNPSLPFLLYVCVCETWEPPGTAGAAGTFRVSFIWGTDVTVVTAAGSFRLTGSLLFDNPLKDKSAINNNAPVFLLVFLVWSWKMRGADINLPDSVSLPSYFHVDIKIVTALELFDLCVSSRQIKQTFLPSTISTLLEVTVNVPYKRLPLCKLFLTER